MKIELTPFCGNVACNSLDNVSVGLGRKYENWKIGSVAMRAHNS